MNNPGHQNIQPFQPGHDPRRNTTGKNKGSKQTTTIIKKLLKDPKFVDTVLKEKPGWWKLLGKNEKTARTAIAGAMVISAINGNKAAADWVMKYGDAEGFDLVDVTSGGEKLPAGAFDPKLAAEFGEFMMGKTKIAVKKKTTKAKEKK